VATTLELALGRIEQPSGLSINPGERIFEVGRGALRPIAKTNGVDVPIKI